MLHMADGAWDITNAANNVFERLAIRLMCWAHVYRSIRPKLKKLRGVNQVHSAE